MKTRSRSAVVDKNKIPTKAIVSLENDFKPSLNRKRRKFQSPSKILKKDDSKLERVNIRNRNYMTNKSSVNKTKRSFKKCGLDFEQNEKCGGYSAIRKGKKMGNSIKKLKISDDNLSQSNVSCSEENLINRNISQNLKSKKLMASCKTVTESGLEHSQQTSTVSDPFELRINENSPPTFKRKFFTSQGGLRAKQQNFSNFEILRKKLVGCSRKPLTSRNISQQVNASRKQLSDEERLRIATTTIWLPVPSIPIARHHDSGNRALFSTPVSISTLFRPAIGANQVLTSNPSVRLQYFHPLSTATLPSPITSANNSLRPVSPISDLSEQEEPILTSKSSVNYDNARHYINKSSPRTSDQHTSFAQPSHQEKSTSRSLHSSQGSSLRSKSASDTSSTRQKSHKDEVSNYADWLEAFSAQLEPYESFNLSTD